MSEKIVFAKGKGGGVQYVVAQKPEGTPIAMIGFICKGEHLLVEEDHDGTLAITASMGEFFANGIFCNPATSPVMVPPGERVVVDTETFAAFTCHFKND